MPFTVSVGHAQKDGRRYVEEVHTDAVGEFARLQYLADEAADTNAIATRRHDALIISFAEQEARDVVDNREPPVPPFRTPRFQTSDELLLKVRLRYLASKGEETCRISRWIVDRLNDGSVTVVQMRTAFGGIQTNVWNGINGRMDTFANAIDSVDSAVGE